MSGTLPQRPDSIELDRDNIPPALMSRDQWICWRHEWIADRNEWTKIPIDPHTGRKAKSTDPDTWGTLEEAESHHDTRETDTDGLGFVFAEGDDIMGVDLDKCRDTDTRHVEEWAKDVVGTLDSFTEVSPSGTGFHVYVIGEVPAGGNRKGQLEMYDSARFFTVTGHHIDVTPLTIEERQAEINEIHAERIADDKPETTEPPESADGNLSDSDVIERAKASKNADKFNRLWSGDTSKYPSHSEADAALCTMLAFWTQGNPGQIDRLFRQSGLMREKWKRDDYRERTISGAINACNEFYTPKRNGADDTDEPEDTTGWPWVIQLFESDENNSTTKAYHAAVEQLEAEHTIKTIRESDEIYFYDEDLGYYLRKGQTYIRELVDQCLGEHANDNRKREITSKWRDRHYISVDEFKAPKGKVNIENGVLDLETREITEHSPEYYFTNRLNVDRPATDEELDGNEWVKQVERALEDAGEREKLHQFIYYCLQTWHCEHEKAAFFVGPPRTGKSTLQEGIQALFGTQPTVSNLTPQQIADTQFDAAALFDAALNTVNDINATPIKDSGALKRIFSGERTKMENKYKDAFFGESTAKHLFTANWLPRIVGTDESIFRRLLIFEFTKQIPEGEKDPRVKRTIKESKNVRRVILRKALDAGETLEANAAFTNDRSAKDTRELWDKWRSNSKLFLYTHFEITADPDDTVEKRSYWQAYNEYCAKNDHEPKSNMGVTKELEYVPGIGTSDDTHYIGLRWDEPDKPETRQAGLDDAQDPRIRKLKGWVDQFSTPVAGADPQEVIEYAETQGYDSDRIADDINTLREEGQLYASDGGIRRRD